MGPMARSSESAWGNAVSARTASPPSGAGAASTGLRDGGAACPSAASAGPMARSSGSAGGDAVSARTASPPSGAWGASTGLRDGDAACPSAASAGPMAESSGSAWDEAISVLTESPLSGGRVASTDPEALAASCSRPASSRSRSRSSGSGADMTARAAAGCPSRPRSSLLLGLPGPGRSFGIGRAVSATISRCRVPESSARSVAGAVAVSSSRRASPGDPVPTSGEVFVRMCSASAHSQRTSPGS